MVVEKRGVVVGGLLVEEVGVVEGTAAAGVRAQEPTTTSMASTPASNACCFTGRTVTPEHKRRVSTDK